MTDTDTQSFLAEHPKLLGVLFALALFSTQIGGAMGAAAHTLSGP